MNILQFSMELSDLIEENFRLKEENEYLRKKVEEHDKFIQHNFDETQKQIGNILNSVMRKCSNE